MTDSVGQTVSQCFYSVDRYPRFHHVRRSLVSIVMACVTGASSSDSINERLRHDPLVGIMANVKSNIARRRGFVLLLQSHYRIAIGRTVNSIYRQTTDSSGDRA
jgi:hypothetical protein